MDQQHHALPTIPVPRPDLDALAKTCSALKETIERFMRSPRPLGTGRRPAMFLDQDQPTGMQDGDFWLQSGEKTTLSVALKGKWHVVGTLT